MDLFCHTGKTEVYILIFGKIIIGLASCMQLWNSPIEGNEVQLIPTNWITKSNKQVLWPPSRSTVAISKVSKSRIPPEVGIWEALDIQVIYTVNRGK